MLQKLEETTEQAATDKQKLHSAIELNRQLHIQLEELKNSNVIQTLLTFSFRKTKKLYYFLSHYLVGLFYLRVQTVMSSVMHASREKKNPDD